MAKLILTAASGESNEIALSREQTTIGRHADNEIVLNDKAVSGRHAMLVTMGGSSFVEDLNSTNGTLVNGRAVAKHALVDGDVISIGRNTLRYALESAAPVPAAGAPESANAKLVIISGPAAGRELPLTKAMTTLGKAGVQVAGISKGETGHALVRVDGPPPLLNGQPIAGDEAALADADVVEIGGTSMRFVRG